MSSSSVATAGAWFRPTKLDSYELYPDLPPRLANESIWLGREHRIV
jgi:hypothetical protein